MRWDGSVLTAGLSPLDSMKMQMHSVPEVAARFVGFLHASPTPFHAVHYASVRLEAAGFRKVREKDNWEKDVKPGGKYYLTRDQRSLLAFTIPQGWSHGAGLSIVATHVDSPNLKVRTASKRSCSGYLQVGVETYGGGIWHSWLDRDLSLAGRVIVEGPNGQFDPRLVTVERPVLRIPSLAIHLDRSVNENLTFNQETQFVPILGLIGKQLNAPKDDGLPSFALVPDSASSIQGKHHPGLLSLLATELSVAVDRIHDFELSLYDTQPATIGGLNNEFIFGSRMDNLFSSFCAVEALAESSAGSLPGPNVNCIALFNHEEVGSASTSGAESSLITSLLQRLSPTPATYAQSVARSFNISADVTHAIHPNYTSSHEENHKPQINGGITIKSNASQKYATDSIGALIVRKLVERKGGKVQEFEARNDMRSGFTIGHLLSKVGIRTVDVGAAILSMHSIRETGGSHDVKHVIDLFSSFFEGFGEFSHILDVD